MSKKDFLVIGHRGASRHMPENTLPAFRLALETCGADMIEFDLHLSRDGVPVVIHDFTLERTTNGTGKVRDHALAELQALDAGFRFDPDASGVYPARGQGISIPSLEEVLEAFPAKKLALELKDPRRELVLAVTRILQKHDAVERCIVGSLDDFLFRELLAETYFPRVFASRKKLSRLYARYALLGFLRGQEHRIVASMPVENKCPDLKSARWIRWLRNRGITVYFWTVNSREQMTFLRKKGADGIMTDDPADMLGGL